MTTSVVRLASGRICFADERARPPSNARHPALHPAVYSVRDSVPQRDRMSRARLDGIRRNLFFLRPLLRELPPVQLLDRARELEHRAVAVIESLLEACAQSGTVRAAV